jgi:hypothetical protein
MQQQMNNDHGREDCYFELTSSCSLGGKECIELELQVHASMEETEAFLRSLEIRKYFARVLLLLVFGVAWLVEEAYFCQLCQ